MRFLILAGIALTGCENNYYTDPVEQYIDPHSVHTHTADRPAPESWFSWEVRSVNGDWLADWDESSADFALDMDASTLVIDGPSGTWSLDFRSWDQEGLDTFWEGEFSTVYVGGDWAFSVNQADDTDCLLWLRRDGDAVYGTLSPCAMVDNNNEQVNVEFFRFMVVE